MLRGLKAAVAVCVVGLGAAPGLARADDASVKSTVMAQEKKIAPDNTAFAKAFKHVTKSNAGKAKTTVSAVISDITAYRSALTAQHASTSNVAKGRTKLLSALNKQRTGLRLIKNALTKYTSGSSEASVKKSLTAAAKQLASGQKDAAAAVKLLGITQT